MKERYSFSKVDTYEQCSFKFKLKYVDSHYISGSAIALDFGTLIHETEEVIANNIKNNEPIDYISLKNNFVLKLIDIEHKFPVDFVTPGKSGLTYREKGYYYLNSGIYRLEKFMNAHPSYEIIGAEIEFNVDYDDNKYFYGKIDRLIYDNLTNKYIIHDIKSYDVPLEKSKLATPLQFVVYALAVINMYNVTINDIECAYDIPLCNIIQSCGTTGFLSRGKLKIDKLFDGIVANEFEPNPSPLCAWCEYSTTNKNATDEGKYLCPYHSNWTKENKTFSIATKWTSIEDYPVILEEYKSKFNNKDVINE